MASFPTSQLLLADRTLPKWVELSWVVGVQFRFMVVELFAFFLERFSETFETRYIHEVYPRYSPAKPFMDSIHSNIEVMSAFSGKWIVRPPHITD